MMMGFRLLLISIFFPFLLFAQIKVKDLPTTSGGTGGDYIIKDDAAGITGSTKKITVNNFIATYIPSSISGSGTINKIPKFLSSSSIGNGLLSDDATNITLASGKIITSGLNFSALTSGSILFLNGSKDVAQDNSNLIWDNTNKRLGIGISIPTKILHVKGDLGIRWENTANTSSFLTNNNSFIWSNSTGASFEGDATAFSWTDGTGSFQADQSQFSWIDGSGDILNTNGSAIYYQDGNSDNAGAFSGGVSTYWRGDSTYTFTTSHVLSSPEFSTTNLNVSAVGTTTLTIPPISSIEGTFSNKLRAGTVFHFTVNNSTSGGNCTIALNTGIIQESTASTSELIIPSGNAGIAHFELVFVNFTHAILKRLTFGTSTSVMSVSGTTNRITSTGGTTPVIDISGSYVGQSSITTLGTIGTGTWQANPIGILYGGSGQTTANNALNAFLPSQTSNSGKVLQTDGSNTSWATAGTGTVTSVGSASGISGGPITTTGTLTNDLITGKAGGQTIIGGTAASENLTLQSTSNATRGQIFLAAPLTTSDALASVGISSTLSSNKGLIIQGKAAQTGNLLELQISTGPDVTHTTFGPTGLLGIGVAPSTTAAIKLSTSNVYTLESYQTSTTGSGVSATYFDNASNGTGASAIRLTTNNLALNMNLGVAAGGAIKDYVYFQSNVNWSSGSYIGTSAELKNASGTYRFVTRCGMGYSNATNAAEQGAFVWHNMVAGAALAEVMRLDGNSLSLTGSAGTARLMLPAGTATASTSPLKFTAGTNLSTAEAGTVEYDGSHFFVSPSTTRYQVSQVLTGSSTLDFPSTSTLNSSDLTITVIGAADSDPVYVGPANASILTNSNYTAFVSATNTVTVRFNNYSSGSQDPASGTFKVIVNKN